MWYWDEIEKNRIRVKELMDIIKNIGNLSSMTPESKRASDEAAKELSKLREGCPHSWERYTLFTSKMKYCRDCLIEISDNE